MVTREHIISNLSSEFTLVEERFLDLDFSLLEDDSVVISFNGLENGAKRYVTEILATTQNETMSLITII